MLSTEDGKLGDLDLDTVEFKWYSEIRGIVMSKKRMILRHWRRAPSTNGANGWHLNNLGKPCAASSIVAGASSKHNIGLMLG